MLTTIDVGVSHYIPICTPARINIFDGYALEFKDVRFADGLDAAFYLFSNILKLYSAIARL
jgi:hypothetical protein